MRRKYAWFAVSDSLPVVTTGAERAARQILKAARRGDAELVISLPAKLAILGRTLAPETFAGAMSVTNQMLPLPTGAAGDTPKLGRDSQSRWPPRRSPRLPTRRRGGTTSFSVARRATLKTQSPTPKSQRLISNVGIWVY